MASRDNVSVVKSEKTGFDLSTTKLKEFANSFAAAASADEIVLYFGKRDVENPKLSECDVQMYLTPAGAKQLVSTLTKLVQEYELDFGAIEVDPSKRVTEHGKVRLVES